MDRLRESFTIDDLWSVLGYVMVSVVVLYTNPRYGYAAASLIASGMLSIFWLASENVRERSPRPNLRLAFWVGVAVISGVLFFIAGQR